MFTPNVIFTVGCSMLMTGRASGALGSAMVSPIFTSGMPEKVTISPASAWSTSTLPRPMNENTALTLACETRPSRSIHATGPGRNTPRTTRPMPILPLKVSYEMFATETCSGPATSFAGAGISAMIVSNSGRTSVMDARSVVRPAFPCLADA